MARTRTETLRNVTDDYLNQIDLTNVPSPDDIQGDILDATKIAFDLENAIKPKGEKWRIPQELEPIQIASIMAKLYPIYMLMTADADGDEDLEMLAIYCDSGEREGLYTSSMKVFRETARLYNYQLSTKGANEVVDILRDKVPRKPLTRDKNLVAVNNGIFDYDTKQLMPFSPNYVFLSKSRVNYNPQATNITIHNPDDGTDWDVESWMVELFDDPELVQLMWEIGSAIIRPNVPWNEFAMFYAETGNNGKGTLCELFRQLCGAGTSVSIPLSKMGGEFALEPLTRASAIIVDENDVGIYIDKAANLKAIVTGDPLNINRKFKTPITYRFRGFMIQCLNEYPRIKDKSDSFYRRQLFVPFTKCFTGKERKYIKKDYLHRTEVLEYVLYKVLHMSHYTLSHPDTCKAALEEYKEFNDPVRSFWEEFRTRFVWDLLPFSFLYDLYKAWIEDTNPSASKTLASQTFAKDLRTIVKASDTGWYVHPSGHNQTICSKGKMDDPEPLIHEYNLKKWMSSKYTGSDVNRICMPDRKEKYRGLLRSTVVCVTDETV